MKLLMVCVILLNARLCGYAITEPCGVGVACGLCVKAIDDTSPLLGLTLYCVGYASDNALVRFTGVPALMRGVGLGILAGHVVRMLYTYYYGKKPVKETAQKLDTEQGVFADDF